MVKNNIVISKYLLPSYQFTMNDIPKSPLAFFSLFLCFMIQHLAFLDCNVQN